MRKYIIYILLFCMSFSFTACKNTESDQKKQTEKETVTQSKNDTNTTTEKKAAKATTSKSKKDKKTEKTKGTEKTSVSTNKKSSTTTKKKKQTQTTKKTEKEQATTTEQTVAKCSVLISCKTVLSHKDELQSNYQVPTNGTIYQQKITVEEGDTALSVLKKTGVSIDVSKGYVEGIDGLYEFDCGKNSGWMYKVNGKFPNVAAGQYKVEKDDNIQWLYTCKRGDL